MSNWLDKNAKAVFICDICIYVIEKNELIGKSGIEAARESLEYLFIEASSEEAVLLEMVRLLSAEMNLCPVFDEAELVGSNVRRSVVSLDKRISERKKYLDQLKSRYGSTNHFVSKLVEYTTRFVQVVADFGNEVKTYREVKENEARCYYFHEIAKDASLKLRDRLKNNFLENSSESGVQNRVKEKFEDFDFESTRLNLERSNSAAAAIEKDITETLGTIKALSHVVLAPLKRNPAYIGLIQRFQVPDMYKMFLQELKEFSSFKQETEELLSYFKIFSGADLVFSNDHTALITILGHLSRENLPAYLEAKAENQEYQDKRLKLQRIEDLIEFVEDCTALVCETTGAAYEKFSREVSRLIENQNRKSINYIYVDLLQAKLNREIEFGKKRDHHIPREKLEPARLVLEAPAR